MPNFDMPSFDEVLFEAIVRKFFEPAMTGINFMPSGIIGANGMQTMTPTPQYTEAPIAAMVREMYAQHAKDLAERIFKRIDVEGLADKVAEKCLERLFAQEPDRWNKFVVDTPEVASLKEAVKKRLAEELTRRALTKLDNSEGTC